MSNPESLKASHARVLTLLLDQYLWRRIRITSDKLGEVTDTEIEYATCVGIRVSFNHIEVISDNLKFWSIGAWQASELCISGTIEGTRRRKVEPVAFKPSVAGFYWLQSYFIRVTPDHTKVWNRPELVSVFPTTRRGKEIWLVKGMVYQDHLTRLPDDLRWVGPLVSPFDAPPIESRITGPDQSSHIISTIIDMNLPETVGPLFTDGRTTASGEITNPDDSEI